VIRTFRLSGTDLDVSELGIGTWGLGGPLEVGGYALGWTAVQEEEAIAILREAAERGVRFIDTSDMYGAGRAETLIGAAVPRTVAVATKGGLLPEFLPGTTTLRRRFDAGHLAAAVDASLRRLRRECIDLYQLHGPDAATIRAPETAETVEGLVRQGKVRYLGVSLRGKSVTHEEIEACAHAAWVRTVQVTLNVFRQERLPDLDWLRRAGKTPILRSVLGHGLFARKRSAGEFGVDDHRSRKVTAASIAASAMLLDRVATTLGAEDVASVLLRWARAPDVNQIVLVGVTRLAQLNATIGAFEAPPLSHEQLCAVGALGRELSSSGLDGATPHPGAGRTQTTDGK